MTYRFSTRRRAVPKLEGVKRFDIRDDEEEIGLIQGRMPDSVEEWNIAQALWRLGIEFVYQQPILGGRTRRGGYVIDFLLLMPWGRVPLEYFGEYWHGGKLDEEDRMKMQILQGMFGIEPLIMYESQATDVDTAYQTIRNLIGALA